MTTALSTIAQTAQCHALLTLSDKSTQDQTSAAQWASSDSSKVSVSPGGLIAAVAPGRADITAVVQGLSGRQTITVSAACTFSTSPISLSFPSSGGSQVVTVTATPPGCSPSTWTAASSSPEVTLAPATGDGNGSVTVTAAANPGAAVTRTVTIADQVLTISVAEAPASPLRTLILTLTQGEQLSGPWAGTVTTLNDYSCTLNQRDATVTCPSLSVENGTVVELLVKLAPHLVNLGFPIRRATGCDALTSNVCRVLMDADKSVTISIGWSVSPGR